MTKQNARITPFLNWAGGKRWLIDKQKDLFQSDCDRYIEPFLGGGAVFFSLKPNNAILSDANADLIQCYSAIRDNPIEIENHLITHQKNHSKEYYYKIRANKFINSYKKAARFLYLNRTCFNGLYRVNLKGEFNVPIGSKTSVIMPTDNFKLVSNMLKNVDLKCCDFAETIDQSGEGDLVYVDPPYTANHNYNGFLKYNEKIFSWDDQVRLRDCVVTAAERGAKIIVSNAAHESVKELYSEYGKMVLVNRSSVLAASKAKRGNVEEIVVII